MRKSLNWRQIVSCLFLIIITIALSIGTINMIVNDHVDSLAITLGIVCCGVITGITGHCIFLTVREFRNIKKYRKTLNKEFKEHEDYCDNELGKPFRRPLNFYEADTFHKERGDV